MAPLHVQLQLDKWQLCTSPPQALHPHLTHPPPADTVQLDAPWLLACHERAGWDGGAPGSGGRASSSRDIPVLQLDQRIKE